MRNFIVLEILEKGKFCMNGLPTKKAPMAKGSLVKDSRTVAHLGQFILRNDNPAERQNEVKLG